MLKMIDPDRALELVLEAAVPAREAIEVPLAAASGLVLAADVTADRDYPPFDRAMMDGYAIQLADAGRTARVAHEARAGHASEEAVTPGRCAGISTGAPCPPGTEAVAIREEVQREGDEVRLPLTVRRDQHIVRRGAEAAQGAVVLEAGTEVTPLVIAVLAAVGRGSVAVWRAPRLALITTGDELARGGAAPGAAQIRDTNGPMLVALARGSGIAEVLALGAQDDAASLAAALEQAAGADVIALTGGVSAGRYDLVPDALRALGAEAVFHKVTQKPGKPLLFARRGRQLIFGVPGNPVSAHFCFVRYAAPVLRRLAGRIPAVLRGVGRLGEPFAVHEKRTVFAPARVARREDGYVVKALATQGSADIFSAARANAYLRLPPGGAELPAGARVSFELFGEAR